MLFAILQKGGQSTTGELVRITGYSQPTVSRACRQLCEAGIATDSVVGWQILDAGLQMVLGSTKNILPVVVDVNNDIEPPSLDTTTITAKKSLLHSVGIVDPMLSKLAKAPHATIEYLEAHIEQWKKEPHIGTGILVNRIRINAPAPKIETKSYTGGKYADLINH